MRAVASEPAEHPTVGGALDRGLARLEAKMTLARAILGGGLIFAGVFVALGSWALGGWGTEAG